MKQLNFRISNFRVLETNLKSNDDTKIIVDTLIGDLDGEMYSVADMEVINSHGYSKIYNDVHLVVYPFDIFVTLENFSANRKYIDDYINDIMFNIVQASFETKGCQSDLSKDSSISMNHKIYNKSFNLLFNQAYICITDENIVSDICKYLCDSTDPLTSLIQNAISEIVSNESISFNRDKQYTIRDINDEIVISNLFTNKAVGLSVSELQNIDIVKLVSRLYRELNY